MSNEEMIDNIKKVCGSNSISYYNISSYRNANNTAVELMYTQMLEREHISVQNKIDDLIEKRKQIEDLLGKITI